MNFAEINHELNNEQAQTMVDSILNSGYYPDFVIDKDNFEILYQNDAAIELYGKQIGSKCYEVFCTRETVCMDCMLNFQGSSSINERYDETLDKNVKWHLNNIRWFDGREVVLAALISIGSFMDEVVSGKKNVGNQYDRRTLDALTRIPTYSKFYADVEHLIRSNKDRQYAIVTFDIEHFKSINDMYGMYVGDEVLKHIARVMSSYAVDDIICGRLHSDVFAFCMQYGKKGDIIRLIEKIRKQANVFQGEFKINIETSYGIYIIEDVEVPANLMCDRALMAEKTVKGNVLRFCAFYDEQYREEMLKISEMENDMEEALSNREFLMYLQPKYSLIDNSLCGAEVLCRWQHPKKGLIPPNDFIPLFERNGFILKLDEYMWEEACKTIRQWLDQGRKPMPLSINISRYHINHNDIEKVLMKLLDKYDLTTDALVLEITESMFMEDTTELGNVLEKLQERGFKIEVDDFGSGFSSLNLIRNISVDTIKIDRKFLDNDLATEKGRIVVNHTINMAKDLRLQVVAEGVETKAHLDFLKESKCDIAQGFFFAKPMPVEEFSKFIF